MKFLIFKPSVLLALLFLVGGTGAMAKVHPRTEADAARTKAAVVEAFRAMPLLFEEGTREDGASFVARGVNYGLHLGPNEAVMALAQPGEQNAAIVRLELLGAKADPAMTGESPVTGVTNHLVGKDPAKWRRGVRNFERVRYQEVYPGIDLLYYGNQSQLEFDFIVAPGSDPKDIRLRASGAERLRIDESGDLIFETPQGEIRHRKPVSFQGEGTARQEIPSRFVLAGDTVTFEVGEYDRAQALVIDPVLAYATFFGGNGKEDLYNFIIDDFGHAYVLGASTWTTDFALPKANPGAIGQTFLAKFNTLANGGAALVFATYFDSGTKSERIALDGAGNIYLGGETERADLPTTSTAFQKSYRGKVTFDGKTTTRNADLFLMKLDPSGQNVLYCTYFGGDGRDGFGTLRVDLRGNAYVIGTCFSGTVPTRNGWLGAKPCESSYCLAKFDTTTSGDASLTYATYLPPHAYSLAIDQRGNAYVGGDTEFVEDDFAAAVPTLHRAYQSTPGDSRDGFLLRLDTARSGTSSLVYATYLGGTDKDRFAGLEADENGNAFILGTTRSADFPTRRAFRSSYGGAANGALNWGDIFFTQIDTELSGDASLIYSTYLGGEGGDQGGDITLGRDGTIYATAFSRSKNLTVRGSLQPPLPPSDEEGDSVLIQIDPRKEGDLSLLRLSRLGLGPYMYRTTGSVPAIAVDKGGSVYLGTEVIKPGAPVKDAYQNVMGDKPTSLGSLAQGDLYIMKISFDEVKPVVTITAPDAGSSVGPGAALNGVAVDDLALGPNVELTITCNSQFFNGTKWTSTVATVSVPLNDAGGWFYKVPDGTNTRDGDYTVSVTVKDLAGNVSPAEPGLTDRHFTVDSGEPTVAITSVADGASVTSLSRVAGTAEDPTGVATVRLYILRYKDSKFWDGTGWGTGGSIILPTQVNGTSWESSGRLPWLEPGSYDIIAIAVDNTGLERRTDAVVHVGKPALSFTPLVDPASLLPPDVDLTTFTPEQMANYVASQNYLSGFIPLALSWDGSIMYGKVSRRIGANPPTAARPFRWSASTGFQEMTELPGGLVTGGVYACSADGGIAYGESSSAASAAATLAQGRIEATAWSGINSPQALGEFVRDPGNPDTIFDSTLRGSSADGSAAAGYSSFVLADGTAVVTQAMRWTAAGGFQTLGGLAPNSNSGATGISGDGSTIVGHASYKPAINLPTRRQAFRWTQAGGMEALGFLPGNNISTATAISADGKTIVGFSQAIDSTAVRWVNGTIQSLGDLPGGKTLSLASAVSGDGKIIGGYSEGKDGHEAFIWDEVNGMQSLKALLVNGYGLRQFARWKLSTVTAISADGTTICGTGYSPGPTPVYEAWRAVIPSLTPEPAPDGPLLAPTTTFKPKVSFSESYKEKLQTFIEPGAGSYQLPVGKGSWSVSIVASTAGINLAQVDGNTRIGFGVADFFHSALLKDDPAYIKGRASATFRLVDRDPNTGRDLIVGTIKYQWNAKNLIITASCSKADLFPLLAHQFRERTDEIDEAVEASVEFAGRYGVKREVYARGNAILDTVNVGTEEEGVTYELSTVSIKAAGDYVGPVLNITSPRSGVRSLTATVDVSGTVQDTMVPTNVSLSVNGGEPVDVPVATAYEGTKAPWTLMGVALEPGPNLIQVTAVDESGAESADQIVITRVVSATLTVSHTGNGSVSQGFEPTSSREIGKFYTVTAIPAREHVFTGWTGGAVAQQPKLTFAMEEGLSLQATFVPDPFPALSGNYDGLITNVGGTDLARNGFLHLTFTGTKTATGSLIIGGASYGFKVIFSLDGTASLKIARRNASALLINFRADLDPSGGSVGGTITDGDFVSDFVAQRPIIDSAHPVPVGKYTMLITENPNDPIPRVQGSAALRVEADGKVVVSGVFGDGATFSCATTISPAGRVPLYARQSSRAASDALFGTLQIDAVSTDVPSGALRWIRSAGGNFPAGVDRLLSATGSAFTPAAGDLKQLLSTLAASAGKAELKISSASTDHLTQALTFLPAKVSIDLPNLDKLSVSSDLKVLGGGTLRGSWLPQGQRKAIPIQGVFFQRLNVAIGNDFPLLDAPGDVVLKAKP